MKFNLDLIMAFVLIIILSRILSQLLIPDVTYIVNNDLQNFVPRVYFAATGQYLWSDQTCNGYLALTFYPPLGFFTAAIFYPLLGASYSIGVTFILHVVAQMIMIYLILYKLRGFDRKKSIIVALLWGANPFFIHQFLKLGRFAELTSWTFVIAFLYFFIRYRDTRDVRFAVYSGAALSLSLLSHYLPFILATGMIGMYLLFSLVKREYKMSFSYFLIPVASMAMVAFWFLYALYYIDYGWGMGRWEFKMTYGWSILVTPIIILFALLIFSKVAGKEMWKRERPAFIYVYILVFISLLAAANLINLSYSTSNEVMIYAMGTYVMLMLMINSPHFFERHGVARKMMIFLLVSFVLFYGLGVPFLQKAEEFVTVQLKSTDDVSDIEHVLGNIETNRRFLVFGSENTRAIASRMGIVKYGLMESDASMSWQFTPTYIIEFFNEPITLSNIDEKSRFLGTAYIISDSVEAAKAFRELGYEEIMSSGKIYLFKTPRTMFPDDLVEVSYSSRRIHVRTVADGRHTIKLTYFPAWEAKTSYGKAVPLESDGGHMSFHADKDEDIIIEFKTPSVFWVGVLISSVAWMTAVAILIFYRINYFRN